MKIRDFLKVTKKTSLPIIADCSNGFTLTKSKPLINTDFVTSSFYQTSKMICYSLHKPLYIVD